MTNLDNGDIVPINPFDTYFDGRGTTCPVCGGKIIHPYTGLVTSEQLDEEANCCTWGEVIDEGDSTIGFVPQCKNIHPYSLNSEDNKYVHYDLIELANTWDMSLDKKVDKLTEWITKLFKDVTKQDLQFMINPETGKLTDIKVLRSINQLYIDLSVDEDGNITVTT